MANSYLLGLEGMRGMISNNIGIYGTIVNDFPYGNNFPSYTPRDKDARIVKLTEEIKGLEGKIKRLDEISKQKQERCDNLEEENRRLRDRVVKDRSGIMDIGIVE